MLGAGCDVLDGEWERNTLVIMRTKGEGRGSFVPPEKKELRVTSSERRLALFIRAETEKAPDSN